MLDFKILNRIKNEAKTSIKSDSDDNLIEKFQQKVIYYFVFFAFPTILALLPFFTDINLSELQSYIGTGISIFTGLFFSLLLNISAKIRIEKENKNIDHYNFQQFKNNLRQISNITQYLIILGVLIMFVVLLNLILNFNNECVKKIFTSAVLFLLIRYFACLFFMLQRFYYVLRDEIGNIL